MKIGIYFASKHGQTRKIADFLVQEFGSVGHEVRRMDLSEGSRGADNIQEFDAVLVGAPVYQGSYPAAVRRFVEGQRRELNSARRSGFFSTCLSATPGTPDAYRESLGPVRKFLEQKAWTPQWIASFPGALYYREYNPLVRWLLRRISVRAGGPTDTSQDHEFTRWDEVARFARDFAENARESSFRGESVSLATRTLNSLMPEYEHRLVQKLSVYATPEQVVSAITCLEGADMPLAELLARIRNFGRKISEPPADFLEAAEAFGAIAINTGQPYEMVGGLIGQFWKRDFGIRRVRDQEEFQAFRDPECTKALTNFWFDEFRNGKTVIRTETRIHSLGPQAQRRFRAYWIVVGLGIRLYMLSVLRGIRRAAARCRWNHKAMAA